MESYSAFIYRWRYLVLLLCLAVIGGIGVGLSKLKLSTNLEVFFEPNDPQLAAYDLVRDTYTRDDNLFLVYTPASGQVFTNEDLAALETLTDMAWQIPHTIRVDSITNFQHTEANADDLAVNPLVEDALNMSQAAVDKAREIAVNEPLLRSRLITPKAHLTAINVTIQLPNLDRAKEIPEVVEAGRAMRRFVHENYPGSDLKLTGKVMGNFSFSDAALNDLQTIVPTALTLALAFIALFLLASSGSILTAAASTFATIVIIIGSVVIGMGMAGFVGVSVTPPVANVPTVILTLAVADCMHILVSFFQGRSTGLNREEALTHTLKLNVQPVFLTSLTTIIGFLALNFSESPPYRDFGNSAAFGIMAAWALSMTLLPALLAILPCKVKERPEGKVSAMEKLAVLVLSRPKTYFAVCSVAILAAAAGLPKNELYDVWAEYFDESMQMRQDADFTRLHLNGFNTLEFALSAGESGAVADPTYLQTLENFANWLREQPEVKHVNTFTDVMKRLNRNMHGDDEAWYRLPDDRDLAAQYLLLYEFSLPFGLDLTNQVNMDKSATRLIASLRDSSTKNVLSLQERSQSWLQANAPEYFFHPGASSDAMFAHTGLRNVKNMLWGALLGLFVISIVIGVALRSAQFGVLSFFLNLLPLAVGFGVWGLTVGRIGMGLSAVSGLTMGIVVDFTVHLLSKYKLGQERDGLQTPEAVRYAFSTVGAALVVTTVVLIANFGLLAFSLFALNSEMGVLTAGIILVALLIDLLFLPPVLLLMDYLNKRRMDAAPQAA